MKGDSYMAENMGKAIGQDKEIKKKKCFIITPIGEDESPIRRHIDGIIDAAIAPVLNDNYEIIVSHRLSTPGSINKQIIINIYDSDLVIANLTTLNPNVMYELAFRHSIRKPVITIMKKDDKRLPFDVAPDRTIFYVDDAQGVINLRENLKKAVEEIEKLKDDELDNPIFSALEGAQKQKNILGTIRKSQPIEADTVEIILNKLDKIEEEVNREKLSNVNFHAKKIYVITIEMKNYDNIPPNIKIRLISMFMKKLQDNENIINVGGKTKEAIRFTFESTYTKDQLMQIIQEKFEYALEKNHINDKEYTIDIRRNITF